MARWLCSAVRTMGISAGPNAVGASPRVVDVDRRSLIVDDSRQWSQQPVVGL